MKTAVSVTLAALAFLALGAGTPRDARAVTFQKDALACQAAVGKGLGGFKKSYLKAWNKCLAATLAGKACDTVAREGAISAADTKAVAAVTAKCTNGLLFSAPP